MNPTITIDLPVLGVQYGGNGRTMPRERNRLMAEAKRTAMQLVRAAMNDAGLWGDVCWSPVHLDVVWLYVNLKHRPDPDNAISRIKPYLDGAVAAGLIPDDSPDDIVQLTLSYERVRKAGIRLVFTCLEGATA